MPTIHLTHEERIKAGLASYVAGELKIRNLYQRDLADAMGISQQALSMKIRKRSFSFEDFVHILSFFGTDLKEVGRILGVGQ